MASCLSDCVRQAWWCHESLAFFFNELYILKASCLREHFSLQPLILSSSLLCPAVLVVMRYMFCSLIAMSVMPCSVLSLHRECCVIFYMRVSPAATLLWVSCDLLCIHITVSVVRSDVLHSFTVSVLQYYTVQSHVTASVTQYSVLQLQITECHVV